MSVPRTGIWKLAEAPLRLLVATLGSGIVLALVYDHSDLTHRIFFGIWLLYAVVGWGVTCAYRVRFGAWPAPQVPWRKLLTHNHWPQGHSYARPKKDDPC